MSLSGNLGFVSLDEVLRLLTRSNQQGAVDVMGDNVHGRIFVTRGGIALATTSEDKDMHRHLVNSGLVDEDYLRGVETGETTLAPIVEKTGGAIVELLREMTVESLYQLGIRGDTFEVYEGRDTKYGSPETFDLESLLEDAKRRLSDWAEVTKTIKDLHGVMRFRRDLGEREDVKVDRDSWSVLSQIGAGASVRSIADELGTTDFWTAQVSAKLVEKGLVELNSLAERAESVEETPTSSESPAEEEPVDPDESWWEEPADEAPQPDEEPQSEQAPAEDYFAARDDAPSEEIPVAQEFAPSEGQDFSQMAEEGAAVATEEGEVEEDTEAFLEKVFSELDSTEEQEAEEGYGLLRRRRLGAMRDGMSDS